MYKYIDVLEYNFDLYGRKGNRHILPSSGQNVHNGTFNIQTQGANSAKQVDMLVGNTFIGYLWCTI